MRGGARGGGGQRDCSRATWKGGAWLEEEWEEERDTMGGGGGETSGTVAEFGEGGE
jgi:hypothetical protein